ncbi:MAG: UbiD family decarboxylase, partial [Nitrospinota bacterium]|nr:UbiD family decarboxylase [Nitrospinota bacterium]
MPKDLRSFLELAEKKLPGGVRRVRREVDPEYELCAILRKLQLRGEIPIVIFEKVKGSEMPLVVNVIADDPKLALTLEVAERELLQTFVKREANPIPPKEVKDGPVK